MRFNIRSRAIFGCGLSDVVRVLIYHLLSRSSPFCAVRLRGFIPRNRHTIESSKYSMIKAHNKVIAINLKYSSVVHKLNNVTTKINAS